MFPAVVILGPRQAGKTTLTRQLMPDWHYADLEDPSDFDRISHDPKFFFEQHPHNLIIDEAQEFPQIFKTLRGIIDADRQKKGRFVITGSSSPELLGHASETLAGRVAIIELGTFKVNEIYQKPLSPFYKLFENKLLKENLPSGASPINRDQLQNVWLKGGYPEPVMAQDPHFYSQWMEQYRNTYINRDIAQLFPKLNKIAYRRFLTTLSKLSGTIINKRDIAGAIEVSEGTIKNYLDIADGTFLWRQLPSFEKNILKSVIKMPKGHIRDTGLLHFLLQINDLEKLQADPIVGSSFEGFIIEEIVKGLQATTVTNWSAHYYLTRNRAEIDLILDGPFGILPIEIKYGSHTKIRNLTALASFVKEQNLPFGIVINQADKPAWLTPEIYQLPGGWL